MKKTVIIFLSVLLLSVNGFADFVISPKLGFANIFTLETFSSERKSAKDVISTNSWNNLAISLDMGFIGQSGLTLFFNNNISLSGSIDKSIPSLDFNMKFKDLKGACWNGELLLGYAFLKPKTQITLAGGIGAGAAYDMTVGKIEMKGKSIDIKDLLQVSIVDFGFALHICASLYFTENIGLAFSLTDTPGYGFYFAHLNKEKLGILGSLIDDDLLKGSGGLSNVFCLKLGPVFKF